jgi:TonB-dependent starch-binding outer membrane protein SusC
MRKLLLLVMGVMLSATALLAQSTITGKITDDKGIAVSGASVAIKGNRGGTSADADGTFKITTAPDAVLVVSAVGYETKEFPVNNQSSLSIQLNVDAKAMSEVVVTGVGVATSKKKLAFAVESIVTDKSGSTPSASIDQFLVGKVAGAQISSTNGSPGRPVNILLRGINTLNRGTSPMILVDGIEVRATDLNSIDLNNIERVEIVQGAASATIYGAQGANGVIQLFSKKGKQGKINIDISTSTASTSILNVGGVQKARNHAFVTDASNVVLGANGQPLTFNASGAYTSNVQYNALSLTSIMNKPYDQNLKWYDHYDQFFQIGHVVNNSINISGAKEKMDFNISGSSNKQNSNFKGNGDFTRYNFSSNFGVELFKNFRFRSITQLVYTKNTMNDQTGRGIIYSLNNARPFANFDFKDADGNYGGYLGDAVGVNHYNVNYTNQYSSSLDNKVDVIQNFNINYKPIRFVELDAKYGLNYQTQDVTWDYRYQGNNLNQLFWINPSSRGLYNYVNPGTGATALSKSGEIDNFRYRTVFQNLITTATIRTDFEKDFHINVPIKTTTQVAYDYRKNLFKQYITYGAQAPAYTPYTAQQMGIYAIRSDYTEPFVTYGYLVNQRIEWGDVIGASAGFRSDYSSAFGAGSKPSTFPRADGYLRVSGFDFWQNGKIRNRLSELKFRAAWGKAGVQPRAFDRYVVLGTRNIGTTNSFVFPTNNPNPDLSVEVSKELEIGTDMAFNLFKGNWFKNASVSFTYWDRSTDNAIYNVDAAPSTGIGTVRNNAFGLASNGIQASVNLNILSTKKVNWNLIANFSKQESTISSITGPPIVVTSNAGSSNYILKAGERIGQLYGFRLLHSVEEVDASGNPYIAKANQSLYTVASNGWVVSKATKQPFAGPLESLGDPNPKFNMSFISDIDYRGFITASMQWDWVNGNNLYNQTKSWMYRDGIHKDYDNAITIDGTTAAYTAFYRGVYQAGANNGTKNYFMEDASFVRLRSLTLGMDFAKVFRIKPFTKLQLVLSGRNLMTFTKYTGFDPEVSSGSANSSFDRGVDHNTVPNLKSYQAGLNIGF